jgi:hypothetical protein
VTRRVRIVVGEGRTAQQGLLRFVLEGEGFDVVGEAKGVADLSGEIEANQPDVVVLDDGIGVMAVSMVHEVAPQAKIVLVWPSAVVPIGGDARVEPAKILRDLGPAVEHVMAPIAALTETFDRPVWIDKVRKDPAALRGLLAAKAITKLPSVTRLQRRSKRLHPKGQQPRAGDGEVLEEGVPAPVVLLPVGIAGEALEPVLDIGGGSAGDELVEETLEERSEWNRRLGMLALSGAAALSAVVLALGLGGGRVGISGVSADGVRIPLGVPGIIQGGTVGFGPFSSGTLGGGGYVPGANDQPTGPDGGASEGDRGLGFGPANPGFSGGSDARAPADDPGIDPGIDPGTDPGTDPGNGGGGNGGGGGGGNGGGGGGNGGGGGGQPGDDLPGRSADHNPHGGPPGQMGTTPAHGPGLGVGSSGDHGRGR